MRSTPKTGIRKEGPCKQLSGPYLRSLFVDPSRVSAIVEDDGLDLDLRQKHRFQVVRKCCILLGLPACRFCMFIPYVHVLAL